MASLSAMKTWVASLSRLAGGNRPLALAGYVLRRAGKDQLLRVAAALSYTSLIALVPLLAMALAVFSAFPAFSAARTQFEEFISQSLVPDAGVSVQYFLHRFVNATGQLTTVGVVGLGVTAVMTLITIDTAFNAIFRVTRQRSLVSRLLVYWTFLTLGPLLLGVSSSLSGGLFALRHAISGAAIDQVSGTLSVLAPTLLSWLTFALLYLAVPNRTVLVRDAALGGAVAAVLFALLRAGFSHFAASANTYRTLYGTLAVIPLFLVSMYLSWAVVLFGAVMTATMPEWRAHAAADARAGSAAMTLEIALDALSLLRSAQKEGQRLRRRRLLALLAAPEAAIEPVLERLRSAGLVEVGEAGDWLLTGDLGEWPMWRLLAVLGHGWSADAGAAFAPAWQGILSPVVAETRAEEQRIWQATVRAVIEARASRS